MLCGAERAVLIDAGMGIASLKAVVDRLTELPVTVLLTHAHWDHIGGLAEFPRFAIHEAEREWLRDFPLPLQAVKQNLTREPCDFPAGFSLENYRIFQGTPEFTYRDGTQFDLGGRTLVAVHTPGHSPGHHQLALSTGMIEAVANAFARLEEQGHGVFAFEGFQIHI